MPIIDDLVTPWLLAIQVNWILSPASACIANGTKRKTPWEGATTMCFVVWLGAVLFLSLPLPMLSGLSAGPLSQFVLHSE